MHCMSGSESVLRTAASIPQFSRAAAFIAIALLSGSSCFGETKSYPPPPQVVMPSGPEPPIAVAAGERLLVAMSDPDANVHILADVFDAPDGSEFRFTGLHPQFLLHVDNLAGLVLYVRFFNHDEALRARGPVSLTVRVNGKTLESRRFDTPGDLESRWPLREGWLEKPGPVEISLDVDPPWPQPGGTKRGVLMHSIGFERIARSSVLPDRRSPVTTPRLASIKVAAILFAGAFTFFVSLLLGKSLLKLLRVRLYRCEELFFGLVLGAACLSTVIFILSVLHLAYPQVFFVTGCGIIALAWRYGSIRFAPDELSSLPPKWSLLFIAIYGVFAALYFVVALCPESSVDGTVYHVALPALYLREHHIPAITTNMLSTLSEGVEMLYLFAFSFGRHSATAMVHLLFTLATPLAMLSYAKRVGSPIAGVIAGLLFFLSPATAVVGTAAYVDVAAAAVVFAVFYLVQIWRQQPQTAVLIPIGLLAGFAYAIKYTAVLAVAYATGAVFFRLRRMRRPVWRPLATVALCAFAMMIPWLAKNVIVLGNPIAPLGNRLFPNPYISVSMERAYVAETGSLGGLPVWEWPYDVTARGAHTQGFVGPVFLLAPLALLALGTPVGRQLLCAAAVFSLPYAAAAPARYLLPALTFLCLALGLVFSRWRYVAAGVVVLHAILSWPQTIPNYANLFGPPGPRLEIPDWRAALRLTPESSYLEQHLYGEERVDGYGIGILLEADVKPGERVFGFRAFQQAYHSRDVLVNWESAPGVRLSESVRAAIDPLYRPTEQHRFSFPPRSVRRIRLLQVGRDGTADQWSVSEFRIFHGGAELPRAREWRLSAFPNEWDVQSAFDNSPLTRWASRQPPSPGMYIEVDFQRPRTIDLVTAQCTAGQSGVQMDLQFEAEPGKWQGIGSRHEVVGAGIPPRLRRAAAEHLLRQNVQWLVVHDQDPGARDFLLRQTQWGISLAGTSERYRLYRVEPGETQRAYAGVADLAAGAATPLRLEGFYELENGTFRWTKRNFAVTFAKRDSSGGGVSRLILKVYVPDSTIQKLGPIRLTARLGDHVLVPATYRAVGTYTFERELQTEWLSANASRFEFSLDKSLPPTPADRRELGIIVVQALLLN